MYSFERAIVGGGVDEPLFVDDGESVTVELCGEDEFGVDEGGWLGARQTRTRMDLRVQSRLHQSIHGASLLQLCRVHEQPIAQGSPSTQYANSLESEFSIRASLTV